MESRTESTRGYVLGSKVYTGKEANVVQKDLGKRAVMLWKEPFLDKEMLKWVMLMSSIRESTCMQDY